MGHKNVCNHGCTRRKVTKESRRINVATAEPYGKIFDWSENDGN